MRKIFKLGDFRFSLEYPEDFCIPQVFSLFEIPEEAISYSYTVSYTDDFPVNVGTLLSKRPDLLVYREGDREIRYIGMKDGEEFYGYYEELGDTKARILVSESRKELYKNNVVFTSLLALEKRMLSVNSMILHCAYVEYKGKAILFSAPSETGKTTQANLWETYRQAETVNGDRGLLVKRCGIWHASGWPVCGTSGVCKNKTLPIDAVVMLSQAKENFVERLGLAKAFSLIYSQITINRWDADAHNRAMNLIEQLIMEVPVYHLACNISEDAVQCLQDAMMSEE